MFYLLGKPENCPEPMFPISSLYFRIFPDSGAVGSLEHHRDISRCDVNFAPNIIILSYYYIIILLSYPIIIYVLLVQAVVALTAPRRALRMCDTVLLQRDPTCLPHRALGPSWQEGRYGVASYRAFVEGRVKQVAATYVCLRY